MNSETKRNPSLPDMLVHTYNPSTQNVEARGLRVLGYIIRLSQNNRNKTKRNSSLLPCSSKALLK
jgi:hypothetical protein